MDERCHRSEGMLRHSSVRLGCKPQSHGRASGVASALRTDTPVGTGGEWGVSEDLRGLCHQAAGRGLVFSLAGERSRVSATALLGCPPQGFLSTWRRSHDVFPPPPRSPHPRETFISLRAREEPGFGGVQGIRKEFACGNLFPPSAWDKLRETEALQLGGELLRAKHVEPKTLLVPRQRRNRKG